MARKNLRERLRRYVATVERRTGGLPPPFPDGVNVVFMKAENGTFAASGHTRRSSGTGRWGHWSRTSLARTEERERQTKLAERQTELLNRETKGTVQ
jgi:hypothetical protein